MVPHRWPDRGKVRGNPKPTMRAIEMPEKPRAIFSVYMYSISGLIPQPSVGPKGGGALASA